MCWKHGHGGSLNLNIEGVAIDSLIRGQHLTENFNSVIPGDLRLWSRMRSQDTPRKGQWPRTVFMSKKTT